MTAAAFALLLVAGVPIAFVLIGATFVFMAMDGNFRLLSSLPQVMFSSLEVFDLLAIPLFILLGELMNEAGVTKRLITAARLWLAGVRNALAYVCLVANLMLASIMGSATAQIAVMSRVMVPEMERDGYDPAFATAITATGGLLGPVIPPSMIFIIYGVIAQVSVAEMFLAGILPGLVMFAALAVLIQWMAPRHHLMRRQDGDAADEAEPAPRSLGAAGASPPPVNLARLTAEALAALMVPGIIVLGISFGVVTPTESAALALAAALFLGIVVYRDLTFAAIPRVLERTALNSGLVLFLIAAAKVFGWVLTFNQVPQDIARLLEGMTTDPTVFLLLVFVFLVLVGAVLDGIAALIILVPIFLPIATQSYGIDPIQFGVVICITLTIGLLTPPVGAGLYIACAITKVSVVRLTRAILPFLAVVLATVLLLILFPFLTGALR
jgi:tripartite ATP-independent transporter DctM subunit